MNGEDALVLIFARNAFYKRLHYLALTAFFSSLLVMGFLIGILIFLIRNPTQPLYFPTDNISRLIQETPVNKPNMTNEEVVAWTIEAVQSAYSYDFVNYRLQLQTAEKYFTHYGWSEYMKALTASLNLVALTQRKQIVIAKVVDKPKELAEGLLGGAYAWKFQMPILVTYWGPPYDDQSKFPNALIITVTIQRQPILKSYKGLGVVQLIAATADNANTTQQISSSPSG